MCARRRWNGAWAARCNSMANIERRRNRLLRPCTDFAEQEIVPNAQASSPLLVPGEVAAKQRERRERFPTFERPHSENTKAPLPTPLLGQGQGYGRHRSQQR